MWPYIAIDMDTLSSKEVMFTEFTYFSGNLATSTVYTLRCKLASDGLKIISKTQFEMEFGGDASYPQVSYGNKHIGNMKETLQFLKSNGILDK